MSIDNAIESWVAGLEAGHKVLIWNEGARPSMGIVSRVIAQGAFILDGRELALPVIQLKNGAFFDRDGREIGQDPSIVKRQIRPLEEEDEQFIVHHEMSNFLEHVDFKRLPAETVAAVAKLVGFEVES